jgi:hypothetical protein
MTKNNGTVDAHEVVDACVTLATLPSDAPAAMNGNLFRKRDVATGKPFPWHGRR